MPVHPVPCPCDGYAGLNGQPYDFRAQIHTIDDSSTNADQIGSGEFCYADAGVPV
ncbi:hypothetical protein FQZ97_605640 [compost metagenome]